MKEQDRPDSAQVYHRRSRTMFWDFEIGLAEAVLRSDSANLDALQMMGHALTRSGRHKEALETDRKIIRLVPRDPMAHYNLACSYSNLGQTDRAFEKLDHAITLGYKDFKFMMRDPDLKNLRRDPRFRILLDRINNG